MRIFVASSKESHNKDAQNETLHHKQQIALTADHTLVGLDHVLNGDALGVLRVHHVDHLTQHVLELDALLALAVIVHGELQGVK